MNYIIGYKAYKKGLINQYGQAYEFGKIYYTDREMNFQKCGYHFCPYLEDTLRYYNGFSNDFEIALVKSILPVQKVFDEYNEYHIYISSNIEILKILSREEIIDYAKNLNDFRLYRFLSGFKLTEEEIEYICSDKNPIVLKYVDFYQRGDKNAFKR